MDGSKSIDRDVPTVTPPKLSYKWQCQVLDGQEKTFCANEYHSPTLVVPPSTNRKYLFTLSVKSDDSNTWVSTTQTVTVLAKVAELEIVCEKNCPPAAPITVAQRLTFLRVICRKNCEGVDEKDYTWTVDGNFDYQNTQYGRNSDKFIVKEDVFKPGLVKIRVDLKGGGSATETLNVEVPLKIDSCGAKPPQGVAINTTFKVECKYTGEGYSFEILTKKKGKVVVLNRNYKLEGLEFVLPVGTDVYVRITDAEDFSDEYKLNVQVVLVAALFICINIHHKLAHGMTMGGGQGGMGGSPPSGMQGGQGGTGGSQSGMGGSQGGMSGGQGSQGGDQGGTMGSGQGGMGSPQQMGGE